MIKKNLMQTFFVLVLILLSVSFVSSAVWNGASQPTFQLPLSSNISDVTTNRFDFTQVNAAGIYQTTLYKVGVGTAALNNTGATSYIKNTNIGTVGIPANTPFALSCWSAYSDSSANHGVFSWGTQDLVYFQSGTSGKMILNLQDLTTGNVFSNTIFRKGALYQWMLMRNDTNLSFWVNGTQDLLFNGSINGSIGLASTDLRFFDDGNGDNGQGIVGQDCVLWNNTYLNGQEIAARWNASIGSNCPYGVACISSPSISNVQNNSITNFSVNINFTISNVAGNYSIVYYNSSGIRSFANSASFTLGNINQAINGLNIYTQYFFNITSCSSTGMCSSVGEYNFTTLTTNTTFFVNAFDDFNGSRIGNLGFNFSNGTFMFGVVSSSSKDTTVLIPTGIWNLSVNGSYSYISANTSINVTNTGSYNFTLYGVYMKFNASTITTQQVLPFNLTITGFGFVRNYTATTNQSVYLPSGVTGFNVNASVQSYFGYSSSLSSSILNLNSNTYYNINFSNDNLTVITRDYQTNISIYSFTASAASLSYPSNIYSATTNGGNVTLFIEQGQNYNITVLNGTGLGSVSVALTGNATYQNITLYPVTTNLAALIINLYDEDTGLWIYQVAPNGTTGQIQLISSTYATNLTNSGQIVTTAVIPNSYEIRYSANGYQPRTYYLNVVNQTTTVVNLYLLNSSRSTFILTNIVDLTDLPVSNAVLKILRYYQSLNAYTIVAMTKSDQSGNSNVDLVKNSVWYKYIIDYGNNTVLITNQSLVSGSTNEIDFRVSTTTSIFAGFRNVGNIGSAITFNNLTKTFTGSWNDPTNSVTSARFLITSKSLTTGITTICDYTINTSSGSSFCTVADSPQVYDAYVYVQQTGSSTPFLVNFLEVSNIFTRQIWQISGTSGAFLAAFIIIAFALAVPSSAAITILLALAGLMAGMVFGVVYLSMTSFVSFVIIGIIILWRGQNGS